MNRIAWSEVATDLAPIAQLLWPVALLVIVLGLNIAMHQDAYVGHVPDAYVAPVIHPAPLGGPVAATTTRPAERWTAISTNYCHSHSLTASGTRPRAGVVAVSMENFARLRGTTWRVLTGPLAGQVVTVEDKGPLAHFDIWVPSCDAARVYGLRTITVQRVR